MIGSAVQFRARAVGHPGLSCQWFFNGTNFIGDSTTNSILRLTNAQPSQAGAYSVLVSDPFGAVNSAPAMLSVIPAVERRSVPGLTLLGQPGTSLNLEKAGTLGPSSNWVTFDGVMLINTSQWYFDLSTPLLSAVESYKSDVAAETRKHLGDKLLTADAKTLLALGQDAELMEKTAKPIFQANCVQCHQPGGAAQGAARGAAGGAAHIAW